MSRRSCAQCPGLLPLGARAHALYCSPACRVAAHRARCQAVPLELQVRPRWVRCSARKVPLTVAGRAASSTDPETWATYQAARTSSVGTGLGFVLNGDGLVCIDLDHALEDGRPTAAAQAVLDLLPAGSFVEVSRSGAGLHVWGWAPAFRGGRRFRVGAQAVEVYASGRFIALGTPWRPGALLQLDDCIADLLAQREVPTRTR